MYQHVGVLLITKTDFRSECLSFQYFGVFEDEELYVSYPVCHRALDVGHIPRCTSHTSSLDQPIWDIDERYRVHPDGQHESLPAATFRLCVVLAATNAAPYPTRHG